jgi:hypothetical protein
MSQVKLLEIDDTEAEEFTRWDIAGHQLNRHLLSRASATRPSTVNCPECCSAPILLRPIW